MFACSSGDIRVLQNGLKLQNSKSVKFLVRFRINKKKKLGKMQKKVYFSNSKTCLAHRKVLGINSIKQILNLPIFIDISKRLLKSKHFKIILIY